MFHAVESFDILNSINYRQVVVMNRTGYFMGKNEIGLHGANTEYISHETDLLGKLSQSSTLFCNIL